MARDTRRNAPSAGPRAPGRGAVLLLALAAAGTLGAGRRAGARGHTLTGDRAVRTALSGDVSIGRGPGAPEARPEGRAARVRLEAGAGVDGSVWVTGHSALRVEGGHVTGGLSCGDTSMVVVSGGAFGGALEATGRCAATVSGGAFGDSLSAYGHSTITLSGGEVGGDLNAYEHSTVNLRGGRVRNGIYAEQQATINVWGTGLSAARDWGGGGQYSLSGRLADGTVLDGATLGVTNDAGVQVVLHDTASGRATIMFGPGGPARQPLSVASILSGVLAVAGVLLGLAAVRVRRRRASDAGDRPTRPDARPPNNS